MNDGWCALALALMSPDLLLPEDAFQSLEEGRPTRRNRKWDELLPEMMRMRQIGIAWQEIAEIYGYSKQNCMCMVSRYKRQQRERLVVA
jgi:hypothetical protein